ncbi:hypothetical protein RUM44_004800 [Polyplax serrata]|uniref:Uncharacterized protein n=1 Tax=Polyplax serrata TaxID=468196 RepID=A0ABR1B3V7_POLSC
MRCVSLRVVPGAIIRHPRDIEPVTEESHAVVSGTERHARQLSPLSSVHTEYEAKYQQKGNNGNESFSTVSGKQEIVHDNCSDNWNEFAEKCATLIKDLVASLANAISSNPGDTTNLQLQIKNSFRHFDSTHNCKCFKDAASNFTKIGLELPLIMNRTSNGAYGRGASQGVVPHNSHIASSGNSASGYITEGTTPVIGAPQTLVETNSPETQHLGATHIGSTPNSHSSADSVLAHGSQAPAEGSHTDEPCDDDSSQSGHIPTHSGFSSDSLLVPISSHSSSGIPTESLDGASNYPDTHHNLQGESSTLGNYPQTNPTNVQPTIVEGSNQDADCDESSGGSGTSGGGLLQGTMPHNSYAPSSVNSDSSHLTDGATPAVGVQHTSGSPPTNDLAGHVLSGYHPADSDMVAGLQHPTEGSLTDEPCDSDSDSSPVTVHMPDSSSTSTSDSFLAPAPSHVGMPADSNNGGSFHPIVDHSDHLGTSGQSLPTGVQPISNEGSEKESECDESSDGSVNSEGGTFQGTMPHNSYVASPVKTDSRHITEDITPVIGGHQFLTSAETNSPEGQTNYISSGYQPTDSGSSVGVLKPVADATATEQEDCSSEQNSEGHATSQSVPHSGGVVQFPTPIEAESHTSEGSGEMSGQLGNGHPVSQGGLSPTDNAEYSMALPVGHSLDAVSPQTVPSGSQNEEDCSNSHSEGSSPVGGQQVLVAPQSIGDEAPGATGVTGATGHVPNTSVGQGSGQSPISGAASTDAVTPVAHVMVQPTGTQNSDSHLSSGSGEMNYPAQGVSIGFTGEGQTPNGYATEGLAPVSSGQSGSITSGSSDDAPCSEDKDDGSHNGGLSSPTGHQVGDQAGFVQAPQQGIHADNQLGSNPVQATTSLPHSAASTSEVGNNPSQMWVNHPQQGAAQTDGAGSLPNWPYAHQEQSHTTPAQPTTFQTTSIRPTPSQYGNHPTVSQVTPAHHETPILLHQPGETMEVMPTVPTVIDKHSGKNHHRHFDDDEDDYFDEEDDECCSCETCKEDELPNPREFRIMACRDLEEAKRELKLIFDKIKKRLKCGRKGTKTIATGSTPFTTAH